MAEGALSNLTIKGFKSIQSLENFELKNLNLLIGANGSGKSNFISFFEMIRFLMMGDLNRYTTDQGGADDVVFCGPKMTQKMFFEMRFGDRGYRFSLMAKQKTDEFAIRNEARYYLGSGWWELGDSEDGVPRLVKEVKDNQPDAKYSLPVYNTVLSWQLYHFHDTGKDSAVRRFEIAQDNKNLRANASNIAPFLLRIRKSSPTSYQEICNAIRLVIPFFDDFLLEPEMKGKKEKVKLCWTQKGSDYPMQPYHLSDGSIRFICLATALLQPKLPSATIIDEPELGLHPEAIAILAELIKAASKKTQLIVATQSPLLINYFSIEDIIVTGREKGASTFKRLEEKDFNVWLEDYSVGELWTKNIIDGGTARE